MKSERKSPDTPRREESFDARHRHHLAGGIVTLGGPYFAEHRDEILNVVKAREAHHHADDPAKKILAIEAADDGVVVSTTEAHLARAIAHALHDAFKGTVEITQGDKPFRADWRR
ncbi:MAG TPA: hypothetical protein VLT89_11300 [Usitatibacter sp.]|nr:hypothetical protein [Usitatibacter sp.]